MTTFHLSYSPIAVADIQSLTPHVKARLQTKLEWLACQPNPASAAELLPKPTDAHYRLRSGVYRILFDVHKDTVTILRVQHRREVYQPTL